MTSWILKTCELPTARPDQERVLNQLGTEGFELVAVQSGTAYLKKTVVPTEAMNSAVSVNSMPVMHAPEGPLTTPTTSQTLMTVENAMLWSPDTQRGEKRLVSLSSQESGIASTPHNHRVLVIICETGKIVRSIVDSVQAHTHPITILGILDEADGHGHTFDPKLLG